MDDRLWTVLIKGGAEVSFNGQGSIQHHDGTRSIWKIRGTRAAVEEVLATAQSIGCSVEVFEDSQTEEQQVVRKNLLGVQREGFVFQTEKCPECFWFDPLTKNNCGSTDWPPETVNASYKFHEKARSDQSSCPLNGSPIEQV